MNTRRQAIMVVNEREREAGVKEDRELPHMHDPSAMEDESGMWSDEYFQMMEADSTTPPERTALPPGLKAKIQFEDDSDDFEPPNNKQSSKQCDRNKRKQAKQKKESGIKRQAE